MSKSMLLYSVEFYFYVENDLEYQKILLLFPILVKFHLLEPAIGKVSLNWW